MKHDKTSQFASVLVGVYCLNAIFSITNYKMLSYIGGAMVKKIWQLATVLFFGFFMLVVFFIFLFFIFWLLVFFFLSLKLPWWQWCHRGGCDGGSIWFGVVGLVAWREGEETKKKRKIENMREREKKKWMNRV